MITNKACLPDIAMADIGRTAQSSNVPSFLCHSISSSFNPSRVYDRSVNFATCF